MWGGEPVPHMFSCVQDSFRESVFVCDVCFGLNVYVPGTPSGVVKDYSGVGSTLVVFLFSLFFVCGRVFWVGSVS